MQARDPVVPHRVIGHEGEIAVLIGGHRGLGAGHVGRACAGCRQGRGEGKELKF